MLVRTTVPYTGAKLLIVNARYCTISSVTRNVVVFLNRFSCLIKSHRLLRQALTWESAGFRRRSRRPRQNWKDVVKKDLRKMGISWDEVEEAAEDRRSWRNRVTQCVFDAG